MDMNLWFFFYSFVTLFVIVDPVMNVPIFAALLDRTEKKEYERIVRKAVIIAAVVLIIFTYSGNLIFNLLGIEMYSFRIAGGILLFIISLEMLFGRRTKTKITEEEEEEWREDIAVTPLAVPLLTGPGAITSGIVLYSSAQTLAQKTMLIVAIMAVFFVAYLILKNSKKVFEFLGNTGNKVISRIMGILLAAISVQFVVDGVIEIYGGINKSTAFSP